MRVFHCVLLACSLIFLSVPSVYSLPDGDGPAIQFDIADLKVEGVVTGVIPGDLNGDKRKDLLILHRTGALLGTRRYLSVFYQWEDGTFSTATDQTWEADSLAQAVGIESSEGNEPSRILYLRRDGVYQYIFREGRFFETGQALVNHSTFFVSDQAEGLIHLESLWERDSEGKQWMTLPDIDGLILYRETERGVYEPVDSIAYRLKSKITPQRDNHVGKSPLHLKQTLTMPRISKGSISTGGDQDFIILYEGKFEGYIAGINGFPDSPDVVFNYDLAMDISTQKDGYVMRPVLHDLDGDSFSDLIVTRQESKGLSGFETVLDIYRGPLDRSQGEFPSQRRVFEDAISYFISFVDLDGDGDLEMAVPVVKLGIFDIIRILTSRTLKVTVEIYEIGSDGLYLQTPRYVHEIKASLDLQGGAGEIVGEVVNINGDRFKDLIISLKPDRLSVLLGKGGGGQRFFERKPATNLISFPDVDIKPFDLTGNGLDDLIATFGTNSEGVGLVRLYLNRTAASNLP